MSKTDQIKAQAKMVEAKYGRTTGASKGKAPVPKVKIKPSGTNPLKKKIGIKATWKF